MPTTSSSVLIYSDGGARGNPGPAATGFVVNHQSKELFRSGRYIGSATNNQAEYHAIIDALAWLTLNRVPPASNCICHLDSQIIVKQITNTYKVKTPHLKPLHAQVQTYLSHSPIPVKFTHIPRSQNHQADSIVNQILDIFQQSPIQLV